MLAQPAGPLASSSLASECSSDAAAVLRDECSDGSSASQPGFAPTSAPQRTSMPGQVPALTCASARAWYGFGSHSSSS